MGEIAEAIVWARLPPQTQRAKDKALPPSDEGGGSASAETEGEKNLRITGSRRLFTKPSLPLISAPLSPLTPSRFLCGSLNI